MSEKLKKALQKARSIILENKIEKGEAPGPKNQKVNPARESLETGIEKRKNRMMFETMQGKIKYDSKGDVIKDDPRDIFKKPFKMKGFSPVRQVEYGPKTRRETLEDMSKVKNQLISGAVDAEDVSDALLQNIKKTAAINKAKEGIELARRTRDDKDREYSKTSGEVAREMVDRNIDDEKFYRRLDAEDEEGAGYRPYVPTP